MYICIFTERDFDVILFYHQGGIDIGDVDTKVSVDLFVCLFVGLVIGLLVCWFVGWFVCLSAGLFVCLFICFFICVFVFGRFVFGRFVFGLFVFGLFVDMFLYYFSFALSTKYFIFKNVILQKCFL